MQHLLVLFVLVLSITAQEDGTTNKKTRIKIPTGALPPNAKINTAGIRTYGTEVSIEKRTRSHDGKKTTVTTTKPAPRQGKNPVKRDAVAPKVEIFNQPKDFAPVISANVPYDCKHGDISVCCSLTKVPQRAPAAVGKKRTAPAGISQDCEITKEYISSPYEIRHIEKAKTVAKIELASVRRMAILEFITSEAEMKGVRTWLERIKLRMMFGLNSNITNSNWDRMKTSGDVPVTSEDEEYLSRFRNTKTCGSSSPVTWIEWIEPMTVYSRHPYAISQCGAVDVDAVWRKKAPWYKGPVSVFSVDHILTQNSRDFFRGVSYGTGQRQGLPTRSMIFDAGSSVFASSNLWLGCAYTQLGLIPDSIVSWERDYVDPEHFAAQIPPALKSKVHFTNKAVIAESPATAGSDAPAPLKVIRDRVQPDDFVALKLDIDSPSTEIPIAQTILKEPLYHSLIDEFFFEFHFQCEFHENCWGAESTGGVTSIGGVGIDRYSAMMLFIEIRMKGIRAHFWP